MGFGSSGGTPRERVLSYAHIRSPCSFAPTGPAGRRATASDPPGVPKMDNVRFELDAPNNIVMAMVTEDDGSEHDYQFDFDPRTGRWEFAERDLLERDFGEEWVEEFEEAVEAMIQGAIGEGS